MSNFFEVFPVSKDCEPEFKDRIGSLAVEKVTRAEGGSVLRVRTKSESELDEPCLRRAGRLISENLLEGRLRVEIINISAKSTGEAESDSMPDYGKESSPDAESGGMTKSDSMPDYKSDSMPDYESEADCGSENAPDCESEPDAKAGDRPDAESGSMTKFRSTPGAENAEYEYADIEELRENSGSFTRPYTPGFAPFSSGKGKRRKAKHTDPDMLYGKSFDTEPIPISDIIGEMREAACDGEICFAELNTTKNGFKILKIDITDYKDTISAKIFLAEGEEKLADLLKEGTHVALCGKIEYDNYEGEIAFSAVKGIRLLPEPLFSRVDRETEKRVELHLHTNYSDMDALTDVGKLLEKAAAWGHKALAITDHGVVQAFPPAFHALQDLKKSYKKRGEELDFKLIYGCEGYLVDDDDNPVLKDGAADVEIFRTDAEGNIIYPDPETEEAVSSVKKKKYYHIILLAANETGRINLYKLVSFSHINYFGRRPRIPRSVLKRYREGIIVGSACVAGEIMDGILSGESDERLEELASFYDYLEIQPTGNNEFLIRNFEKNLKGHKVKDTEGLRELNLKVLRLGDECGRKVCATGDVHFLNPEDEMFRRIILDAQKYADADCQPPLYFHTTEEMLEEFSYLGEERAREVVITNTNLIADMIEDIEPLRPDKCPPVIANSEQRLSDIVYENARKMYGSPLPEIVRERIEKELNSIISNGYAVLYIIAMELVNKSVSDGYLVGSRGSVGSSFVATMAGITEVNPLKAHYRCPGCGYSDFDTPHSAKFSGGAGCDLPDKDCPVCGKPLLKDGFDIPFETFMGFKGEKEPDIDLNFSGEYQARAHAYTEELFGAGHTFRAGTISALQDKTAYGFVRGYAQNRGRNLRKCEINRLVRGCVDVKRSTGQHPGGIVVLPHGEEIYSFTPLQHPANDASKGIITTHFEYHSIDHNLLKLDELGHDDPTMIKMLEDITGFSARKISFDNPKVMELFHDIRALGVEPEDVDGYELGTLGVPEFGTDFVMGMLKITKPENFSDLVRISGLSHGTDVWLNNAQNLVSGGTATLSECICTRDDIMTYLMQMGLASSMAFDIMENVRKGKIADGSAADKWEKWKKAMTEKGVPAWYPASCEKIQYMFPKAHAVAYVMMAYRIAYYKIFYPIAYYAAYFSVRASAFNAELMCRGKEHLLEQMDIVKRRISQGEGGPKDEVTLRDMKSVLEMYSRGFEFMPIDLYRAKAVKFQVIDGKIMPSFISIDGMGEKAAASLCEAAAQGAFTSVEEIKSRTKLSSSVLDKMRELGILDELPESSQMTFADYFGINKK